MSAWDWLLATGNNDRGVVVALVWGGVIWAAWATVRHLRGVK